MTLHFFLLAAALAFVGCGDANSAAGGPGAPDGGIGSDGGSNNGRVAVMPLPERGIPDPILHDEPAGLRNDIAASARVSKGASGYRGGGGSIDAFDDRYERCVQAGGSPDSCALTAGLCEVRDGLGETVSEVFDRLIVGELTKNYYCDEGCFHCCWVPGAGDDGAGGGCHTSFDTSEGDRINCNPGLYGEGTMGLGAALIVGDATGNGSCIGGVQQLCNHLAQCNGAGSTAGPGGDGADGGSSKSLAAKRTGRLTTKAASEPPHPNMSDPQAVFLHLQSFENAMRRNFFRAQRDTPAGERRKAYIDFITARGTVNWLRVLREVEPWNRQFDLFAVKDEDDHVLPAASYHAGIVQQANLAFLGAVPNILDRLAYVESRYWTEDEKAEYLDGIDPEAELRKTMGPLVFEALKGAPVQDWRLLAQAAPNEPEMTERRYDGFLLGQSPIVTTAQDCIGESSVSLAVTIEDPEEADHDGTTYPILVDWGDGTVTRHFYDSAVPTNVYTHAYAEAGSFIAYVTVANSSGLRGVTGIVIEAEEGTTDPAAIPSLATAQLDDVVVYSPSVSLAGDLSFEMEAFRTLGPVEGIGWSDVQQLANAGPNQFGDIVGYNEALTQVDMIVLRPFHTGGWFLDSVYFKAPSITLGVHDQKVGALATHTTPLTAEMVRVYYEGAVDPVPPELLERDLNGELLFPVLRENVNLPADFCGAQACERVDRIEIDLSTDLLAERPSALSELPGALRLGDTARWVEDVPNVFIAAPDPLANEVPGECTPALEPMLVTAADPSSSFVTALAIEPANAVFAEGSPMSLRAIATLEDGRTLDVTRSATWASLDETVLRVSNGGDKGALIAGTIPGAASIQATLGGVTAETTATHDAPIRGYQSYRIHFDAVHGGLGKAAISGVELFVDGRLLESLMESEDTGTIGPFAATVQSSEGGNPTNAFDVTGSAWSSAEESFARDDPYAVGDAPVYLQVNFETPVPVDGIRILRTAGILFASYGPWFPQTVRVQGSDDGVTFSDIDGATITFTDWNGEPALVEWDLN